MRNTKVYYGIRILVGGYLAYLAVQLLQGVAKGDVPNMAEKVIMVLAGILFLAVGAVLIITALRTLGRNDDEVQETEEPEEKQEEAAGEEPEAARDPAALEESAEDPEEEETDRDQEKE